MPAVEDRLQKMGLQLPNVALPLANYVPFSKSGNLLFVSGHVSRIDDDVKIVGKLGADLDIEQGYDASKMCALSILGTVKTAIGDLDNVVRIVKIVGMVNASPDFADHPRVVNGASDLLSALFQDRGKHSRSAVGVSSLPGGYAVEIEAILEI